MGRVPAALLALLIACARPAAFALTVEPFETDVEPVDSAEKNRAEELSTAEPIDLGGNTDDLGPQTFAPPADDDFDYTDDEEETGNHGENGNGDAYGNAGETGHTDAFDNVGETGNGDGFGIAGDNGNSDVGDVVYGQEPGNAGETGYADDSATVGDDAHGEEPGDQGETENLDEGTGAQWGGEVDDAAYEGSNDLKKAASDEVIAGSGNGGNGTRKAIGHPMSGSSATNHTGKLSANVNETIASSRDKNVSPLKGPKNETTRVAGRRLKSTQTGSKVVRNKSASSLNGTHGEDSIKYEDKVKNETNSAGDENRSGVTRRIRGKSRVSRGGVVKEIDEPRYWNGYKTYVNVNRTRVSANATDTGNKSNETGNTGPYVREHGGDGVENSEVTARVVEIQRDIPRSTPERNNVKCWESASGNCSEARASTPTRKPYVETSNDGYRFRKNETKPEVTRPTSGGLLQAESNKRSYNYDETQVPPPAGEVQEIITYDYGDITEIIIPDNSPAPIPSPSPAAAALRYGLHPDSNPHAHNSQPYYEQSTNEHPKYTPENYPKTTVPHNALPTYGHFHPPPTSPYPTRSNFDNYGSNVERNQKFHSPSHPPSNGNFDYAPSYNQNSSHNYNSYQSMPRTNPSLQSVSQNPDSGHEFKSPVNSDYNQKSKNYAPQYGGSSNPSYNDPGFHSKHSGPNTGTTPYYTQYSSGPVYEFHGTPKSKTWVSYESIPIKNPSTDAGPPVVEIIYHRENGVVYEDDIFDDLTTSSPESAVPLTSTSGYFPFPGDFSTSGDYPAYGNGRPPSRNYGQGETPKNRFSNDTRNKKRPTNNNFRPAPLTSDAPRVDVSGRTRPQKKRPNVSSPTRKPDLSRPDSFDVEDFPDDFPEEPKVRDPIAQSKKRTKLPQKSPPSRKLVKPAQGAGHENPKHYGFSDDRDTDFPPKSKTKAIEDGKDILDSSKNAGFDSDDESFPKHTETPDFPSFPKITETTDFSADDFPSRPKIPDLDSDDDDDADDDDEEFSEKDLKEFEEGQKLITRDPHGQRQAGFEHDHEHKKTKSTPSKNSDPPPNLRQRKEKSEKSNKGEKYDSGHKKSQEKKSEKSVKSDEKSSEGERLHKSEASETEGALKKGAKKKESKDEGGYYAEKQKGEEGEKAAKFHDDEKHAKGHSTKGKHEIHKKDEFSRKHSFFDEHHEGGKHEKEGGYEAAEEIEKGGEFHAGHKSGSYKEGHKGKKGRFKEGKRFEEDKGEEEAEGHDEKSEHQEESAKKEGKEQKEKKAFEL